MAETTQVLCRNPDCDYAKTQKCIDGLDSSAHPQVSADSKPAAFDSDAANDELIAAHTSSIESLWTGECLDCSEASKILRRDESRVLAVIGPTKSGKTSLICSVFELLQIQVRDDFQFAGSLTLFAFERACHNSRGESLRHEPVMEHTRHNPLPFGVSFYHLKVAQREEHPVSLLFADRTGEDYKAACDDPSVCSDFVEVKRADSITILVDGQSVLNSAERHNVRSTTELIVQGLKDGGVLSGKQALLVVLTKQDMIEAENEENKEKAYAFFESLVQNIQRLYSELFENIQDFKIAASPQNSLLPYGHGVFNLMSQWYGSAPKAPPIVLPAVTSKRAMGRIQ